MRSYLQVLSKCAVFEGRARRKEYWGFFLWNVAVVFVLTLVDGAGSATRESGQGGFVLLYQLATLIPSIAVAVRRMHDTNHSGWWALVPFASFVFAVTEGDQGANQYGPNPNALPTAAFTVVGDTAPAMADSERP